MVASLKAIPADCVQKFRKFFEGIESTYVYYTKDVMVFMHTSCVWYTGLFKKRDQGWPGMISLKYPAHPPLFSSPKNRTKNFLTNFPEYGRVFKEAAIHWPTCPHCKQIRLWFIVQTDDPDKAYELYDNRTLICFNARCKRFGVDENFLITDIKLPDEKDTALFIAPFLQSQARRRKILQTTDRKDLPLPRRFTRFWTQLGRVFPRKLDEYANDTAYEKSIKGTKDELSYFEQPTEDGQYHEAHIE